MRLSLSGAAAAAGATQLTGERFSAGAKAFDESVRGHKGVLVFSKTTCPYCDRVKKAFDSKSIPYSVVELDRVDKSPEIRTELTRLSGINTVPVIFIGGQLVGDSSTTIRKLTQGELDAQLRAAGISV